MENSRLPEKLSMMTGVVDDGLQSGKKQTSAHHHHDHATNAKDVVSVTELTGPRTGTPDRQLTLTAEKKSVKLSSGKTVEAWTYNGQIPGPELRMKEGGETHQ
jgi:FtsP/CotA-like multicopper oxidase with cupredoxin domain